MVFPAEWHQQAFVQLTWPHEDTDWAPVLADAIDCFCEIAREVTKREPLLIVAKEPNEAKEALTRRGISLDNVTFVQCSTNDTWARDHAFITCIDTKQQKIFLQDFQFNGWGLKFAANEDNQINRRILSKITSLYRDASIEYFNELYGYLEHIYELQNFFNGKPQIPYIRLLADGTTRTELHTKEYIIRNIIHHPENTHNSYTEQELRQAIIDMRAFIAALP